MTKINIPFEWSLDIPSVVEFTFQMDSERAGDTEGDMEEMISFIVDLNNGEILWVHDYIMQGITHPWMTSFKIQVIGKGWYFGYDGGETFELFPSDQVKKEIGEKFISASWLVGDLLDAEGSYWSIVKQVCELGVNGIFSNARLKGNYTDVYEKYIGTEKPDGYM
jgi:hypothetical protein